jgi:hypothetical protein
MSSTSNMTLEHTDVYFSSFARIKNNSVAVEIGLSDFATNYEHDIVAGEGSALACNCDLSGSTKSLRMVIMGVKWSWPGHTGVIMLPRGDNGGLRRALSYSPGW